jgi:chromosomal replication initiation ATPase DnaA
MLIYLLWKTGRLSNIEIGKLFGLTYSMVSRSVKEINNRISNEKKLREQYQAINSLFKV